MTDRYDYVRAELREAAMASSPQDQLAQWLEDAASAQMLEPRAMCLSTVGPDGRPSARFVLLRTLDADGLTFFTNYRSRKGSELESNPFACVTFWWSALERQVRVEGQVEKIDASQSDAYFHSRPRESQLASAASPQSQVVAGRQSLEDAVADLARQYPDGEVPRPEHWGGYRLNPDRFEFWQGRAARLHDRIEFVLLDGAWQKRRLAP